MSSKLMYGALFFLLQVFVHTKTSFGVPYKHLRGVKIKSLSYEGSGCPENSVFADLSPDKEVFTFSFSNFVVSKEGSLNRGTVRKDCLVSLELEKPKHLSFKFFSIAFEGSSDLEAHIRGALSLKLRSGASREEKAKREIILDGPYADSYELTEEFDLKAYPWKDCHNKKTKLTFRAHISVGPHPEKRNDNFGFMSTDQIEGFVKEKVGVLWKDCRRKKREEPYLSFCKVLIRNKERKIIKKQIKKHFGTNPTRTLKKAKEKALRHCKKFNQSNSTFSCQENEIKCETKEIS